MTRVAVALAVLASTTAALDATSETFSTHVGGRWHTIVTFDASWCKACTAFAPILKEAIAELRRERTDVRAVRVDGEKEAALRTRFNILEAPGVLFMPAKQPAEPTFGAEFDQLLENVTLPSDLQSLTFASESGQSLENGTLPSSLQSLTFGVLFNQSLQNVTLPSSLQILTFGHSLTKVFRMSLCYAACRP